MNGLLFRKMLEAGYASLKTRADEVNDLNVFPIPDGDTGDNMCSTLSGGIKAANPCENLSEVAETASRGMVLGARGNSGVILSQIFSGLSLGFQGKDEANVEEIIFALEKSVETAYKAVDNPVEGTMLTVLKTSVIEAKKAAESGVDEEGLFNVLFSASEKAVEETPEQLYVLKEAGVVDSGGKGLSYVFQGFLSAVRGEETAVFDATDEKSGYKELDLSLFDENSVMQFGYCTEFLLRLQTSKIDVESFNTDDFIETIKPLGDSIVCFQNGTIVKVHIHTFSPGVVLNHCQKYGEFLTLKIENMTLQHEGNARSGKKEYKKNPVRKDFGVVAVATGDGVKEAFTQLGVDIVVDGGQGANPSTEDFIKAYDAVNADEIFVLPDNGNILPVAVKSGEIYTQSKITVIPTKSIGDGYSALSAFDLSLGGEACAENMKEAVGSSCTIELCKAVRSTVVGGVDIEEGDYIAFAGKEMIASDSSRSDLAALALKKKNAEERDFLIIIAGNVVEKSEAEVLKETLEKEFPNIETYLLFGGQNTFDYIFVLQ